MSPLHALLSRASLACCGLALGLTLRAEAPATQPPANTPPAELKPISLVLLWLFTGSIVRPLKTAASYANQVADGDFRGELQSSQSDEVGALTKALSSMVQRLRQVVAEVQDSSQKVASGAVERACKIFCAFE